jgi:hypothetical protein
MEMPRRPSPTMPPAPHMTTRISEDLALAGVPVRESASSAKKRLPSGGEASSF